MIDSACAAQILRLFHSEHWPISTIARQVGVHHSVVRRVLRENGVGERLTPQRPTMLDPYLPFLLQTLNQYPTLPASRLFDMLKERGYPGQPDHFRAMVARYRPKPPAEAFLHLRTLPGEQAQVDWAHFGKIEVPGGTRPLVAFVMVLSWSRQLFLRFGLGMQIADFLDHHQAAFTFFGGVPRVLLYDNLKSAVLERQGDAIRFNDTLLSFAGHFRYEPRPVAPYRGNEKGRVERSIRYVRSRFFPARTFADLNDLNAQALVFCEGIAADRPCPEDRTRTVRETFTEEKRRLLPLPSDSFPCEARLEVRIGKTPYLRFDGNDYSVPFEKVRRTLTLWASPTTVRVVEGSSVVATHSRSWGKAQRIEDPSHIAALIEVKREARAARGLDQLAIAVPQSRDLLLAASERGYNLGALTQGLLRLLGSYGARELSEAIEEALRVNTPHASDVRQIVERRHQERGEPPLLELPLSAEVRARDPIVRPHELSTYDILTTKEKE